MLFIGGLEPYQDDRFRFSNCDVIVGGSMRFRNVYLCISFGKASPLESMGLAWQLSADSGSAIIYPDAPGNLLSRANRLSETTDLIVRGYITWDSVTPGSRHSVPTPVILQCAMSHCDPICCEGRAATAALRP